MFGLSPFLSRLLAGKFGQDCNEVKANEFFVSEAYNSLVQNLYDMVAKNNAFRSVYDPATPGASSKIMSYNDDASDVVGTQHRFRDTWFAARLITDPPTHKYVQLRQVERGYVEDGSDPNYCNDDPIHIAYGAGDISNQNPYAFVALDLSEGNEQYLLIEYTRDSALASPRYSNKVEFIFRFNPVDTAADVLEIIAGDEFVETTVDDTYVRYGKYIVTFGSNISVASLISALNAYPNNTFTASYKGGANPTGTKIVDIFNFYDTTSSSTLKTITKVLRFIPPMPRVVIDSPTDFFTNYFNKTAAVEGSQFNILEYTEIDSVKTFINTGVYGFLIRKTYDDAGSLMFPTQIEASDHGFTYIPNKITNHHYTKSTPLNTEPSWFDAANSILSENFASSIDMDGNYFFLPFVEVTDSIIKFAGGSSISIDDIIDLEIINVSSGGSYLPNLKASRVRFDSAVDVLGTHASYTQLNNVFNVIKGFLSYSATDNLTDQENTLDRVAEFTVGLMWYLNNVVVIDRGIGNSASYDAPELNVFHSLEAAHNFGALKSNKTVIIIAGRDSVADRDVVDGVRFLPQKLPKNITQNLKFMIVQPSAATANYTILDPQFTLSGADKGTQVFQYEVTDTETLQCIADTQDFTWSDQVIIDVTAASGFTDTDKQYYFKGCAFNLLQIIKGSASGDVWEAMVFVPDDNVVENLILMDAANTPFDNASYLSEFSEAYPIDLSGSVYLLATVLGSHRPVIESYAPNGRIGYAEVARTIDIPTLTEKCHVLGVLVNPNRVESGEFYTPSIVVAAERAKQRSELDYKPKPLVYDISTLSAWSQGVYAEYFNTNIVRFDNFSDEENLRVDMDMNIYIDRQLGEETRNISNISGLIKVRKDISDSDIRLKMTVDDGASDYFSRAKFFNSSLYDFPDNFMFIDCGMNIQPTLTGGTTYVDARGGIFERTRLVVDFQKGTLLTDDNLYVDFFQSDLFHRSAYILYFADQHPAYSYTTRRVSEDLDFLINTPPAVVTLGAVTLDDTSYNCGIKCTPRYDVDTADIPNSYPKVPEINASFAALLTDPLSWLGKSCFLAGMSRGEVKIDIMNVVAAKAIIQIISPTIPPYTAINLFEDVSGTEIELGQLQTKYELPTSIFNYVPLPPQMGLSLLTVSNIYDERMNRNTKLKIGLWQNRAEITQIIGGYNMEVDIAYRFETQADVSGISDVGQLEVDGGTVGLPDKPWFSLVGVRSSNVRFVCADKIQAVGTPFQQPFPNASRAWTEALVNVGWLRDIPIKEETPNFSAGSINKVRPMRVVIGGIFYVNTYTDPTTPIPLIMPSSNNKIFTHCTRANLIIGGYNHIEGLCYVLDDDPEIARDTIEERALDFRVALPSGSYLSLPETINVWTDRAYETATSPISSGEHMGGVQLAEFRDVGNDMMVRMNPCRLATLLVNKTTGRLKLVVAGSIGI